MPPQYHDKSFWEKRFEHESSFEWLGNGQATMLPPLVDFLIHSKVQSGNAVPGILHIGAGMSTLQEHVQEALIMNYGDDVDCRTIVNTDFSGTAVMKGRKVADLNSGTMQWVRADLLDWVDIQTILSSISGRFAVVLDKSTSDAISCGPSIAIQMPPESNRSPLLHALVHRHYSTKEGTLSLSPLELLAIHLASCIQPGGIWIVLSYSSNRFPFLRSSYNSLSAEGFTDVSDLWIIESTIAVDAPSGQERPGVYAPIIQHHLYILRRTRIEDLCPQTWHKAL